MLLAEPAGHQTWPAAQSALYHDFVTSFIDQCHYLDVYPAQKLGRGVNNPAVAYGKYM